MKADRGWLSRLAPSRLSSRLTATMVITAATVFLVVAAVVGIVLSLYTRSLGLTESRSNLAEAHYQLELQAREIDALVMGFTQWNEFYGQTSMPDSQFVANEFDPWLRERANASAVVWTDSQGRVINEFGDSQDVETLRRLIVQRPEGLRGSLALPTGPAVVTVQPIVGDPAGEPVGGLAVARAVTSASLAEASLPENVMVVTGDEQATGSGWRAADEPPPGFSSMQTRVRDGVFATRAVLEGVDSRPALTLELTRPDPWLGEGRLYHIIGVSLLIGLCIVGVGYAVGTVLGRSIVNPLHSFVQYLQEEGYLALQGLRTDEKLLVDPGLPEDFFTLGQVITDLMTQLRVNQAELIEAGDQALAAERAFRTVVEESPEVKILVRGGVVEIANPAAAHFFGLQLGDLLRAQPDGLFSGIQLLNEGGEPLELLDVARRATEAPVIARCVAPEQPDRWMELSVAFIDDTGTDYVISARNITEERRLEALRAEVLSLVSHDLRSPLTVVRGYLDILGRPLDEERRGSAIEAARRASLRMEELLDDLLHATRAERVFAPRVMRPIDLSALVEGIVGALQMGAEQTITATLEEGVTVLGDPVRLEQAITNLVSNALKYGPREGEVRVKVETQTGRAVVSVEDDGDGIPEDQREAVFERGARLPDAKGTPGMGLGLYIVRVVAEAHGGLAFVDESSEGHTRFVFDLPLMQQESESA